VGAICPGPRARTGTAPFRIDKAPGNWLLTHSTAPPGECSAPRPDSPPARFDGAGAGGRRRVVSHIEILIASFAAAQNLGEISVDARRPEGGAGLPRRNATASAAGGVPRHSHRSPARLRSPRRTALTGRLRRGRSSRLGCLFGNQVRARPSARRMDDARPQREVGRQAGE
jgi:hypothetical protein